MIIKIDTVMLTGINNKNNCDDNDNKKENCNNNKDNTDNRYF